MSRDTPKSPAIDALAEAGARLAERGLETGVVSARHGLRSAVSQAGAPLGALAPDHFSEVVDYDPHGDRLVLIGSQHPGPWGALHALVYRARQETGAMLQADLDANGPAPDAPPVAEPGRTPVETALAVLELLRNHAVVRLGDAAVLAVGGSVAEAEKALVGALDAAAADGGDAADGGEAQAEAVS